MIGIDIIKEKVSESYGIDESFKCSFIRRSFNDHYLIKKGKKKYIIRVYLNDKYYIDSIEDIHFELEFLKFLKSRNVSIAYPIENTEGSLITRIIYAKETRHMVLFSYASGHHLDYTLDQNTAMKFGKEIAKLHMESNYFEHDHNRYRIDLAYLIDEPLKLLKDLSRKYSLDNCDFFDSYAKRLYCKLNEIPLNENTFGLIHGDLNPSNIHVNKEGNVTIFDFDHCTRGLRIHDLAVIKLCFDDKTYNLILNNYKLKRNISVLEEQNIDTYSKSLLLRKYKDVISMQRILGIESNKEFDEKEYVRMAIESLHELME